MQKKTTISYQSRFKEHKVFISSTYRSENFQIGNHNFTDMVETLFSQNHTWYHGNRVYARVLPKKKFHLASKGAAVTFSKEKTQGVQLFKTVFITEYYKNYYFGHGKTMLLIGGAIRFYWNPVAMNKMQEAQFSYRNLFKRHKVLDSSIYPP